MSTAQTNNSGRSNFRETLSRVAHSKTTVFLGIVFLVLGAVGTGIAVYWYFLKPDTAEVAPEVEEALEEDAASSTYSPYEEFTSFEYGYTFEYNAEQHQLTSTKTTVELTPRTLASEAKTYRVNAYDTIVDTGTGSKLGNFTAQRLAALGTPEEGVTAGTEEVGTETINGIETKIYKYSYQAFRQTTVQSIHFFFVNENTGYELILSPYDENVLEAGKEFLEGFSFVDTSQLDPYAEYTDVSGAYEFTYDRREWILQRSASSLVVLSWEDSGEIAQKASFRWEAVETSLSDALNVTAEVEKDRLQASAEKFVLVSEEETTLGGEDALKLSIRYKSQAWDSAKFLSIFVAVKNDTAYIITGEFTSAASEAIPDFDAVIETFAFVETAEETTEVSDVRLSSLESSDCSGFLSACAADSDSEEDGADISETELITSLNKPAVVRVLNEFCIAVDIDYYYDAPNSTGQTLNWCDVSYGSGFFVEETGYVMTNGHVAVNLPNYSIYELFAYGLYDNYVVNFIIDLAAYDGYTITAAEAQTYFQEDPAGYRQLAALFVISLVEDNGAEFTAENDLYAQYQEKDVELGMDGIVDKTELLEMSLVDYRYDDLDSETLMPTYTGDVALLEPASTGDYPIVNLGGTDEITEGMKVIVLGFPGVVDYTLGSFSSSGSYTLPLTGKPTITSGVVSSIHEDLELIQVDASISEGNSGGPGFSMDGNVVGIVTYKAAESGAADYNYLRLVEEIEELMDANGVDNNGGEVDSLWRDGMDALISGNYEAAAAKLKSLDNEYPAHRSADRYLHQAEELAEQYPSEDDSDSGASGLNSTTIWILVACGGVIILVGGGLLAIAVFAAVRRKQRAREEDQIPSQTAVK